MVTRFWVLDGIQHVWSLQLNFRAGEGNLFLCGGELLDVYLVKGVILGATGRDLERVISYRSAPVLGIRCNLIIERYHLGVIDDGPWM